MIKSFVIDTNIYIDYILKGSKCFSRNINMIFSSFENENCILYVPTICFWEINTKIISGKLKIKGFSREEAMKDILRPIYECINFKDLSLSITAAALAPSFVSKLPDPFDQIIVASALDANFPLITRDSNIIKSKLVETIC